MKIKDLIRNIFKSGMSLEAEIGVQVPGSDEIADFELRLSGFGTDLEKVCITPVDPNYYTLSSRGCEMPLDEIWKRCLGGIRIPPEWAANFPEEILSSSDNGESIGFNMDKVGEFKPFELQYLCDILRGSDLAKELYSRWEPRCKEEVEYDRLVREYVTKHVGDTDDPMQRLNMELQAEIDFAILYRIAVSVRDSIDKFISAGILSDTAHEPIEDIKARTEAKKWSKLRSSILQLRDNCMAGLVC